MQVPGYLAARPAIYAAQADLGEDRLYPERDEAAVVPRRQVRSRQQQGPAGLEHPQHFLQRRVGIDEMLDQLAHDHDIRGVCGQRQAGRLDAALHQGQAPPTGVPKRAGRPVKADHAMPWVGSGREAGRRPVTAAHVKYQRRDGHAAQHPGQQVGHPPRAVLAGTGRSLRVLVELVQRLARRAALARADRNLRALAELVQRLAQRSALARADRNLRALAELAQRRAQRSALARADRNLRALAELAQRRAQRSALARADRNLRALAELAQRRAQRSALARADRNLRALAELAQRRAQRSALARADRNLRALAELAQRRAQRSALARADRNLRALAELA